MLLSLVLGLATSTRASTSSASTCLARFGPQTARPVCAAGETFDSYAAAHCAGAADGPWHVGPCDDRRLEGAGDPPREEPPHRRLEGGVPHGNAPHENHHEESDGGGTDYLSIAFIGVGLTLGVLTQLVLRRWAPSFPFALAVFLEGVILELMNRRLDGVRPLGALSRSINSWGGIDPHLLLFAFMPVLLFGDAMAVDAHLLDQKLPHVLLLAVPGVLLGAFATAGLAMWVFPYDWTFVYCLLFGSILAATDPVAVVAFLKDLGASPALTMVIMGESLLNDGTAASLFLILLGKVIHGRPLGAARVTREALRLAILGPVLGYAFGIGTIFVLLIAGHKFHEMDTTLQLVATFVSAYASFFVAEHTCHSSGILATVVDALVLARYAPPLWTDAAAIHVVWETFGWIANTLIFELAGVLVMRFVDTNSDGIHFWRDFRYSIAIYLGVNVIRFCVVFMLWPLITYLGEKPAKEGCGKPLGTKEAVVVSWAGLRGAVGLALAIVVWHEEGGSHSTDKAAEQATRLVFHVAMMAALTLAVNAPTTAPLLRALGLGRTDEKTLTIRSLVVYNVGATCRGVFDALRNAQNCTHSGRCRPFDAAEVVKLCSVLRYHEADGSVHSPFDKLSDSERLVLGRELYLHALKAESMRRRPRRIWVAPAPRRRRRVFPNGAMP